MTELVKMLFGSHLYGTDTKDSDTDYKGIFVPSMHDMIMCKVQHTHNQSSGKNNSKNTSQDIDYESFSIQRFVKLASEGQTVAIDMLHAPRDMITHKIDAWDEIQKKRSMFYTKNMDAFIGYAQRQAAKYGIKGSRLDSLAKVLEMLKKINPKHHIGDIFTDDLFDLPHINRLGKNTQGFEQAMILGKIFSSNTSQQYVLSPLQRLYDEYGQRAMLAKENKGVDFKAVSHAVRAALQLKEIYLTGDLVFPLKEADFIKRIKTGELHYADEVAPELETLIDDVKLLAEESNYPENVDKDAAADIVKDTIFEVIKRRYE